MMSEFIFNSYQVDNMIYYHYFPHLSSSDTTKSNKHQSSSWAQSILTHRINVITYTWEQICIFIEHARKSE